MCPDYLCGQHVLLAGQWRVTWPALVTYSLCWSATIMYVPWLTMWSTHIASQSVMGHLTSIGHHTYLFTLWTQWLSWSVNIMSDHHSSNLSVTNMYGPWIIMWSACIAGWSVSALSATPTHSPCIQSAWPWHKYVCALINHVFIGWSEFDLDLYWRITDSVLHLDNYINLINIGCQPMLNYLNNFYLSSV